MCGRFVSASAPDEVARYFGALEPEVSLPANYNVAPSNDIYGVVEASPDSADAGHRLLETFHWGLVPIWAKDIKVGYRMINARSETAHTKGAYKKALADRRCLVPADGFYEWKKSSTDPKKKQPFYITAANGEPLAIAGIWERWWGEDKSLETPLHSVSILTTSPNAEMARIHDRMPLLIPESRWNEWLDRENRDLDEVRKLLVPAADGTLVSHPVDPAVGKVSNKGPELIEPYEIDDPGLFDD